MSKKQIDVVALNDVTVSGGQDLELAVEITSGKAMLKLDGKIFEADLTGSVHYQMERSRNGWQPRLTKDGKKLIRHVSVKGDETRAYPDIRLFKQETVDGWQMFRQHEGTTKISPRTSDPFALRAARKDGSPGVNRDTSVA